MENVVSKAHWQSLEALGGGRMAAGAGLGFGHHAGQEEVFRYEGTGAVEPLET